MHLPSLSRYFCKSMPSFWQRVAHTPPICITIRLPFVLRYFAEVSGSGVVGTPPNKKLAILSCQEEVSHNTNFRGFCHYFRDLVLLFGKLVTICSGLKKTRPLIFLLLKSVLLDCFMVSKGCQNVEPLRVKLLLLFGPDRNLGEGGGLSPLLRRLARKVSDIVLCSRLSFLLQKPRTPEGFQKGSGRARKNNKLLSPQERLPARN